MFDSKEKSGVEAESTDNGRLNRNEIRLTNEWDVIYWCLVLQCTSKELENLVSLYGPSAAVIKNHLNAQRIARLAGR